MNAKGLYRFESLAQELIEGKVARLFGGRLEPLDVANRLALIMENHNSNGTGPISFTISLNPDDYAALTRENKNLAEDIADTAWQIWQNMTNRNIERPEVAIKSDPNLSIHKVKIVEQVGGDHNGHGNTAIISRSGEKSNSIDELNRLDAFLIIQGRRHVSLNKPVITIGRQIDNDIVLENPAVSRRHAQIRWRFGRFALFDISAKGKTSVNGQPILEQILQPGDVLSLSEVLLIYGEGFDAQADSDYSSDDDNKTLVRVSKSS